METDDTIYLVEVKGEDKLSDPDVIAKKKRGIQYCEVASRWGKAKQSDYHIKFSMQF